MLQIHILGSGSTGNATLIRYERTRLLIDCGLPAKTLRSRFVELNVNIEDLSAVLITHEHTDHITGLPVFTKRPPLPVYLTEATAKALRFSRRNACQPECIKSTEKFPVGPLEIQAFPISHDANDPLGFVIRTPDGTRLGIATDLGHPSPEVVEALKHCDLLGLECNHDPQMLLDGPYPWFLKQRIKSHKGHLSNQAAADLLRKIAGPNLRHLFALHLSRTNNRPKLAHRVMTDRLTELGLKTEVTVASHSQITEYPPSGQLGLL